jgi:hypothetical protein
MAKHSKLVNALKKLHFIEDSQKSVKEIRRRIEQYEKRNLELVSKWSNGIPEWALNKKYNIDTKISELKWKIYDDCEAAYKYKKCDRIVACSLLNCK